MIKSGQQSMEDHEQLVTEFSAAAVGCLHDGMQRIRHCHDQLSEDQLWWRPKPDMNSIGNLLLHVAGNLRQWIIAGVGDEPDTRQRQAEFDTNGPLPTAATLGALEVIAERAEAVIRSATGEDLLRAKRIQGRDTNKMAAIWHSLTHFHGHVQEIIGMTRQQLGDDYQFAWSPSSPEEG
ncbi:MAG: DinB family protein [Planctomycetaceae bacterium]